MPTDPTLPPYLAIAADIEQKIRSGQLKPGEKLSPVSYLADEVYHKNKNTVTKALDVLRGKGLIVSRQGYGVFVAAEIPAE